MTDQSGFLQRIEESCETYFNIIKNDQWDDLYSESSRSTSPSIILTAREENTPRQSPDLWITEREEEELLTSKKMAADTSFDSDGFANLVIRDSDTSPILPRSSLKNSYSYRFGRRDNDDDGRTNPWENSTATSSQLRNLDTGGSEDESEEEGEENQENQRGPKGKEREVTPEEGGEPSTNSRHQNSSRQSTSNAQNNNTSGHTSFEFRDIFPSYMTQQNNSRSSGTTLRNNPTGQDNNRATNRGVEFNLPPRNNQPNNNNNDNRNTQRNNPNNGRDGNNGGNQNNIPMNNDGRVDFEQFASMLMIEAYR